MPHLRARREKTPTERIDLADIAPDPLDYLGQAAYVQLEAFEALSSVAGSVGDLHVKHRLASAAGLALAKHQGLVAELRRHEADPAEAMMGFAPAIDRLRALSTGSDWCETLLGVYVTTGLLDDFFIRLSAGVPGEIGPHAAAVLGGDSGAEAVVAILSEEIGLDAPLASRLALWGRRLVGDTLLVARTALQRSGDAEGDEQRYEPVFTEVIAAHTRRMDALGLTA